MQIEILKTVDLIPYARNARKHTEGQISQIAGSIQEFGFINPVIIDKDNNIIAGHGRVLAAEKLGLEDVPTLKAEHLTEAQVKAYRIIDNRYTELSDWDNELLKLDIEDLQIDDFDLETLGFDADELSNLLLSSNFNNNTEDSDSYVKENFLLEIEFPDEQAQKDAYDDLCSQGFIVRLK